MTSKKLVSALLKTIESYIGHIYVYGGKGQIATKPWIQKRAEKDPSYFTNGRLAYMLKRITDDPTTRAFDCSGLITRGLEDIGIVAKGFRSTTNAHKLYTNYCEPIGTIRSLNSQITAKGDCDPEPGDLVFRKSGKKMVHVAIVHSREGNDFKLIEAVGGAYGVRYTYLYDRKMRSDIDHRMHELPQFYYIGRLRMLAEV